MYSFTQVSFIVIIIPLIMTIISQETVSGTPSQIYYKKIAGGHDAVTGQFPFVVNILEDGKSICGGTLISDRWILTAAHCLFNPKQLAIKGELVHSDPSRLQAAINQNSSMTNDYRKIKSIHTHPDYRTDEGSDFGLLELAHTTKDATFVQPVKLARNRIKLTSSYVYTALGWGKTTTEEYPSSLQQVDLYAASERTCKMANTRLSQFTNQYLCVGLGDGKDTCIGDSGGPLLVRNQGQWIQVGITSYGDDSSGNDECGRHGTFGFYARVSYGLPWILATTGLSGRQISVEIN